jgi:hypothetical protein
MPQVRKCCADCHFFAKEWPGQGPFQISAEQRDQAKAYDFSWRQSVFALVCYRQVWDEGYSLGGASLGAVIADTERRRCRFYLDYQPGMLFPAARTLQEQEAACRQTRRDRTVSICGLAVALLSLAINVWLTVAAARGAWPFCNNGGAI